MIQLTINNSVCRLEGLPIKLHKELGQLLSYRVGSYNRFYRRSLLGKHGDFPAGLLYLVKQFIRDNHVQVDTQDLRKRPKSLPGTFKLKLPYTPYPEQEMAAKACLKHSKGIVVAPTALGKSTMAAMLINELQVRTLVVVPTVELKRQLIESFSAMFPPNTVGGNIRRPNKITIVNVDGLNPKYDMSPHFDCVIVDEFHHSGAATYRKLNKHAWKGIFYKFGFTATPFRSQDDERLLLESVLSRVIYRITYKLAVEKGYIKSVEAYYYELPKIEVDGVMWPQVYKELVVDRKDRNTLISHIMAMLKDQYVLCLVKEIRHGDILRTLTGVDFANGQDEDSRKFIKQISKGTCRRLIGTTGVLGEGVDTKPVEYVIIAGLGKSKNQFMQMVGRGFRLWEGKESCKVIIFKDPSHKWTRAHYNAQRKFLLDEYGVVPVKLELPEDIYGQSN